MLPLPVVIIDAPSNALPVIVSFAPFVLELPKSPLDRALYILAPSGGTLRLTILVTGRRRGRSVPRLYFSNMRSPFPGMDPYLEQHWEDVHTALIGYVRDTLQPQLSDDLIARMEEKVYVEEESEKRLRKPAVHVVEHQPNWSSQSVNSSTAVLDEPILLQRNADPIRHRSVLIYDTAGKRIVTAIEILSPWNKSAGKPQAEYLKKRDSYVNSETNLVEIDLIRTGDWTTMIGDYPLPDKLRTTYRVTIAKPDVDGLYLYPISMDAKLPTIKVPLRPTDAPAILNLQELLDKAYQMGRYDRIEYTTQCIPRPALAEKAWFEQAIKTAQTR
jgi:hypothetical protein